MNAGQFVRSVRSEAWTRASVHVCGLNRCPWHGPRLLAARCLIDSVKFLFLCSPPEIASGKLCFAYYLTLISVGFSAVVQDSVYSIFCSRCVQCYGA